MFLKTKPSDTEICKQSCYPPHFNYFSPSKNRRGIKEYIKGLLNCEAIVHNNKVKVYWLWLLLTTWIYICRGRNSFLGMAAFTESSGQYGSCFVDSPFPRVFLIRAPWALFELWCDLVANLDPLSFMLHSCTTLWCSDLYFWLKTVQVTQDCSLFSPLYNGG